MVYPTDNVYRIEKISRITNVSKIDYSGCSIKRLQNLEQYYQHQAVLTNDWFYYKELLEIRKQIRNKR